MTSPYLARQLERWTRPNAHLFVRPDWRRHTPRDQDDHPFALYERKYRADQPRVPAGSREGGQWTGDGGGGGASAGGQPSTKPPPIDDPRVISDAVPSNDWKPGAQYAQNRRRGEGFGTVVINGQQVEPTPGQAARLAVAEGGARDAIRRVQELDPNWKPTPSAYESVEGLIGAYQADARQALDRISELGRVGIGPGPYAGASIPARGPERDFTAAERREINKIGSETGCHTCGTTSPETPRGNFVLDHQPPTAWNPLNEPQRLYPKCASCSSRQGNWIRSNGGRR